MEVKDMIFNFVLMNILITLYETVNYFISIKEEEFRKYFLNKKPIKLNEILSIVIPNCVIYLVFFKEFMKLLQIENLYFLSIIISFFDTFIIYQMMIGKFLFSSINRFIFNAIMYYQYLQMNIIFAIITYVYVIFICSNLRTMYPIIDNYILTNYKNIEIYFTIIKEKYFTILKETREFLIAK
jgi:hypothetical protein